MLLFIMSLILGVVVMFIVATAERMLNGVRLIEAEENKEGRKLFKFRIANALAGAGRDGWIKAAIIGTTIGVVNFFIPKVAKLIWLEPIFLAIVLGLMAYLMIWWHKDGTNLKEMICFVLLTGLFYQVSKASVIMMRILVKDVFWMSVISVLPLIMLFVCIGFFIIHALFYYYEHGKDEKNARLAHIFGWVAIILTTLAIILTLIFGVKWNAIKWPSNSTTTQATATKTQTVSWYGFYNLAMLKDEDESNDFNFGFNPYDESKTAKDYDEEFRKRIKLDVALGAADMAWFDANLGTRYMGAFYDECDEKWDAAINYAKERFMGDQVLYYKTLDGFFAFLDTATKVEITQAKGIEDQMYMNPYTSNGIPDVIVMKTDEHTGWFLTYTFIIKGQIFEVSYRIDCGFQPCDVEHVMKITPQEKPTNPDNPKPDNPKPDDPKPDDPKPDDPKPSNPKDPTQGTPVGGNDNPGPGPNTNNGVGAQYSSEEKPTNSTYMSYDEYKEIMQELEEVNETQKEGGDPNTPTVTPKPNTNVDSNADSGTGNGGIDTPTPEQEPVHVVNPDGETEPISTDLGTAWGGPVD